MLASRTVPGAHQLRGGDPTPTRTHVSAYATVIVLAIGVGMRMWRPDLAQVNFDESNVGSLVAAWKYQGLFPLVGTVSSYGFRAGPGWPWFAAIGLLGSDDPYALVATGLAAGIGGLLACWWVARRWLGAWGGVAAALFHGTLFWCVVLERGAWQPVFLQAPMALCLDALLRLGVQRRPWALAVASGWLGVLISVHYTAIAFVVVFPLAMWFARSVLRPLHLMAAVVVGALSLLPLLVFEANPAVRFAEVGQLLSLSGGTASTDIDTLISTWKVSTTFGAAGLGGHAAGDLTAMLGRWNEVSFIGPVLAGIGLLIGIAKRPGGAAGWLIAAWALAPIVVYLRHSAPVIFHYMFIEFFGVSMGVGVLGAWAACSHWRLLRVGVAALVGVSAVASALSVGVLLGTLDRFDLSAGYGIPVGYTRQASEAALGALPAGGQVLIGDDPHSGEVLRFGVGYGTPSGTFEDCLQVPFAANAVYLLASEQTPGAAALDRAGAQLQARVPRPGGDAYRIYAAPPTGPITPQPDPGNPVCADRSVWDASA